MSTKLILILLGWVVIIILQLAARRSKKQLEEIMAAVGLKCQVCRSTELSRREGEGEDGGYRCEACGFDTSMRKREGLVDYFEALRSLDLAIDAFDEGRRLAQGAAGSSSSEHEAALGEVRDAQMRGLEWVDEVAREFSAAGEVPMLDEDKDLARACYDYLAEVGAQAHMPSFISELNALKKLKAEAEAGLHFSQRARVSLAKAIELRL